MKGTDPSPLVAQIDMSRFNELRARKVSSDSSPVRNLQYVEPAGEAPKNPQSEAAVAKETATIDDPKASAPSKDIIRGKISRLGDYIDTDALAPAQYLVTTKCNADIAPHCLERTHPGFRSRVQQGNNIVVAGKAFGCGSSRQEAVMALLGCGVQAVIAPSFAFIYSRNQPSLGLVGIVISDPKFYELAADGVTIAVDLDRNVATVEDRDFEFEFSEMEKKLMDLGGIVQAFEKYGKEMFRKMCAPKSKVFDRAKAGAVGLGGEGKKEELAW